MRYSEADVIEFQRIIAKESPDDAGNPIWNIRHGYDAGCKFPNWSRSAQGHLNTFRRERGKNLVRVTAGESGVLSVVDGQLAVDRQGNGQIEPWIMGGYTHFDAPALAIIHGDDVHGLLDEPIKYGANAVVWFYMRQSTGLHPHRTPAFAPRMRDALDAAAEDGMRVLLRVLVDTNGLGIGQSERLDIWHEAIDLARGRWNVIVSLGNELAAEGIPREIQWQFERPQNMRGVLCSNGTQGGRELPQRPFWDLAEYEPTRNFPAAIFDSGTGLVQMRVGNVGVPGWGEIPRDVALLNTEPIGFHDVTVPGSRSSDVNDARALGSATAFAANMGAASGAVFHTTFGQTCDALGSQTEDCAAAFFNALYAGFTR